MQVTNNLKNRVSVARYRACRRISDGRTGDIRSASKAIVWIAADPELILGWRPAASDGFQGDAVHTRPGYGSG